MKKLLSVLILGCLHAQLSAQTIDTKHILLNLYEFNWQKKQVFGNAVITFSTLTESDHILLDAGFLTIYTVKINEQEVSFQNDGGDATKNVRIQLDRIYSPEEEVTVEIQYASNHENKADPNAISGSFGKGLRFLAPTSTTPTKRLQIWSSGEPDGNKYWFPCNEELADVHTMELYATVPKPLTVISNGTLVERKDHGETCTFHYKTESAIPNYLVSIVVGEYANVQQQFGKTIINNYGYPDEKKAVKATVELLPAMMQFLEAKTGYSYPFGSYSQVVVQDYPFPGLVGQNSVALLSDNYIDDYQVHQEFQYLWDGVAVQALANQWFGNIIMPTNWTDLWLNNAFAQYFAGMYTAKCHGSAEYLLWYFPFEKWNVTADWEAGNKHPIAQEIIGDLNAFGTDSYSKFKGALILRMLQHEMGDENWWKAVHVFVKNNAHKQVSTADFQHAVESVSGTSYQWFFDQWIYKMGLPECDVVQHYDASTKQLSITIKQLQAQIDSDYPQVDFFEGKVKIEIDDKLETVYLKPQQENTFLFPLGHAPEFVNFNSKQTFLCVTTFSKSNEEFLATLLKSRDFLAKQDALNQLVAIANDSTTSTEFKLKIRAAFIHEVQSDPYWRYRMLALGALSKIVSVPFDEEMIELLKDIIRHEDYWLKSSAISILGNSADASFEKIYRKAMHDKSDRVINAAAIAMGKTKSPKALNVLLKLEHHPSWKNQSRISALNGLQHLGDPNAVDYVLECIRDNQSSRWYLATPTWDYPFAAVNTLVALGKAELAYPNLIERFKQSLDDNDLNDIFQLVQLIDLLNDERAKEMYGLLKEKFSEDESLLETIHAYELTYLESIEK